MARAILSGRRSFGRAAVVLLSWSESKAFRAPSTRRPRRPLRLRAVRDAPAPHVRAGAEDPFLGTEPGASSRKPGLRLHRQGSRRPHVSPQGPAGSGGPGGLLGDLVRAMRRGDPEDAGGLREIPR